MSFLTVRKSPPLHGDIHVPGDKSITHRAILLGGVSEGLTMVKGYLPSEDCLCTLGAMAEMGIKSFVEGGALKISGKGLEGLKEPGKVLNMGNSGTSLRLLTGLLAGQPFFSVLDGDDTLRRRPMARLIQPLSQMGAEIRGRNNNNLAPIAISGKKSLKSIDYQLPIASAQLKSALLLAGLFAEGLTRIYEPLLSRDHTERMLKAFGAKIDFSSKKISILRSDLKGHEIQVPGDFSSAAFFIVAATIVKNSMLVIRDVGINPTRTGLLEALRKMGGKIKIENCRDWGGEPVGDIVVQSAENLKGIELGEDEIPSVIDELPILFVAAAYAEGETKISGAQELRVKESDRIGVMAREIRKMGVQVMEFSDGLQIVGRERTKGGTFKSDGDHRVAMSMAVAGLAAEEESTIEETECINTSFPGFKTLLDKVSK